MGPVILCDKSTIQSLHRASPELLHRYFSINVPPILVAEILGDLAKDSDEDSEILVRTLARRLCSVSAIPNTDFRELVRMEMGGSPVSLTHRPVARSGKAFSTAEGKVGIEVADDPCEQALNRWRMGDFSIDERIASALWRARKKETSWHKSLAKLAPFHSPSLRAKKSFEEVLEFVDDLLATSAEPLARWFCQEFGINFSDLKIVFALNDLPYTTFCLRLALFALWAMEFKLVPTKADNFLDLEYLFYLPFANGFSTRDKFQKAVVKPFLDSAQEFIGYEDLAEDLSRIDRWLSSLDVNLREEEFRKLGPPEHNGSCCHMIWKKTMGGDYRHRLRLSLTKRQEAGMLDYVKKMVVGAKGGEIATLESADDADFVFRRRSIHEGDPCPCGSGKPFSKCHALND